METQVLFYNITGVIVAIQSPSFAVDATKSENKVINLSNV
jgi:hypothetical protein